MGVSDAELYKPAPAGGAGRPHRLPSWHKMAPLFWAPAMYLMRFAVRGRVSPPTQHKIFAGMVLTGLSHAGVVMSADSTT